MMETTGVQIDFISFFIGMAFMFVIVIAFWVWRDENKKKKVRR